MIAPITDIALDLGLFALDFELETGDDRRGERVNESADGFRQLIFSSS